MSLEKSEESMPSEKYRRGYSPYIPQALIMAPWLQQIVGLIQVQRKLIQSQSKQKSKFKETVEALKMI